MRELQIVAQARTADWGHAVELDLEHTDGSKETIKIPYRLLSPLMVAINQAAVIAERMQRAQPGQTISVESPFVATNVHTGAALDSIVFRFLTTIGTPIVIAMSLEIARRANERSSRELENLGKQPPFRPS